MKILSAIIIAAVAAMPACARTVTPSSNIVSKTVSVGSFDEIDVSRVNLVVHIGNPTGSAKISAPDNLIEELQVKTSDGELDIRFPKNFNFKGDSKTTVEVTVGSLKEIDASLSSKVEIRGALVVSEDIDLSASTSARILLGKVSASDCDIEASTSGSVSVQQLKVSGKADVHVSTSASAKIGLLQGGQFKAEANTSGSVTVNGGSADKVDFKANTSGTVNAVAMKAETGKAEANTGSQVKCNIACPTSISSNTGGRVKNN